MKYILHTVRGLVDPQRGTADYTPPDVNQTRDALYGTELPGDT